MLMVHLHPAEHLEIKGPRSLQRLYGTDTRLMRGKPLTIHDDSVPVGTITLRSRSWDRLVVAIDLRPEYRVSRGGRRRASA